MFLLMFMVHPFDVLNILTGHIVFYRFVIGGAYYGTYSLSFTTSFAVHIFCFHIFIVIFSPIQGFFWNQHSHWGILSFNNNSQKTNKQTGVSVITWERILAWMKVQLIPLCCDPGTCQNYDHISTANWNLRQTETIPAFFLQCGLAHKK